MNKPPFSDEVARKYFYYYNSYVFSQEPPTDSFTSPHLNNGGKPVDEQVFGPLMVAFAADPFHGATQAPWWRQAYAKPDIGLNHPARWTWDRETKTASFNFRHPPKDPPDPKSILNDLFYHMKGLFIGQASDDPNHSPMISVATAGDRLRLQARVYNFSVADMPAGSSVHVRFFGQEYDKYKASLVGDGFLIGESTIGSIPGFNSDSNQGKLPNWKLASTTFDTTNYSGKFLVFWVLVWAQDTSGALLAEQEGHGLTANPANLSFKQITDIPVEDYSNNVGMYGTYSPFFVAPKSSPASDVASTEQDSIVKQLQVGDIRVEAAPVDQTKRSWVTVTLHNTSGRDLRHESVTFYDGDPQNGGTMFDYQNIPFVAAGDTYALRTFLQTEVSGTHELFVRVGRDGAFETNSNGTSLVVP